MSLSTSAGIIQAHNGGFTVTHSYASRLLRRMRHNIIDIPADSRPAASMPRKVHEYVIAPSHAHSRRIGSSPRRRGDRRPVSMATCPSSCRTDKVQVKYEMLRAHIVDGLSATAAAEHHGYSARRVLSDRGSVRGPRHAGVGRWTPRPPRPLKLTPEIVDFIAGTSPEVSSAHLAEQIEHQFSVRLHRRTVERARR